MTRLSIAVDGPASAGKGTVARAVADALGYRYVDTGAMYRAVAWAALRAGVPLASEDEVVRVASAARFDFGWDGAAMEVRVDGVDVTHDIRRDEVGTAASAVSALPGVRALLLDLQRETARGGAAVLDGRDIGTVVLPHADVKVFLDASLDVRAGRRAADLASRGEAVPFERVRAAMEARDLRDRTRAVAPLRPADDAVVIDTSNLTIAEARDAVLAVVRQRVPAAFAPRQAGVDTATTEK